MIKQDNIMNGIALGGTAGIPFGWVGMTIGAVAIAGLYIILQR